MSERTRPIDPRVFALRRELRDLLDELLNQGQWSPAEFDRAIERLARHRQLALRQVLLYHREGRIADEVSALELLGRLARPDDAELLAATANDPSEADSARVACALVLLGQNFSELIQASDVSALVLQWQASYLAEEPGLRAPLMKLFASAPSDERARWIALQDRELTDPSGRAAVFEMLLEVERDPELRVMILAATARIPSPVSRAALKRMSRLSEPEREIVAASLAVERDEETIPAGWSARVGYCDGTGSFPLRIDHRYAGARPRSAVFVIDLKTGVRESLALSGGEVERYDRQDHDPASRPADHPAAHLARCEGVLMFPVDVREALGILDRAERGSAALGMTLPRDHEAARRLLDPLADLRPIAPVEPPPHAGADRDDRSARLLDHPGYRGWFYDSGDHALDAARLAVLERCPPGADPPEELIDAAARALSLTDEPLRIATMLHHNARVHHAADEREFAGFALDAAGQILAGGFADLALVRRMVGESLHPGHFFFSPIPDIPDRHDIACLMLGSRPPSKGRVFAIDLAWCLARAAEVWLSRIPCSQRPHSDLMQHAVLLLASRGAQFTIRGVRAGADSLKAAFASNPGRLAAVYRTALGHAGFPEVPDDADFSRLLGLLVDASRMLIVDICLDACPERCPERPREDGQRLLETSEFPAGDAARRRIRTWPGTLVREPDAELRAALEPYLAACGIRDADGPPQPVQTSGSFLCGVCGDRRPLSARSRSVVDGDARDSVCRRCQRRYRHDASFRARVERDHGPLTSR